MCWTLALWGGVPAESEHISMLAAATGKRIVVQTTGGCGWVYDPEEGDGSSVYVMWDGDDHFDGLAKEAEGRPARSGRAFSVPTGGGNGTNS